MYTVHSVYNVHSVYMVVFTILYMHSTVYSVPYTLYTLYNACDECQMNLEIYKVCISRHILIIILYICHNESFYSLLNKY